jgi:translocator assembly and maintenance protein 41
MSNLNKLKSIIPNSFPEISNIFAYGSAVVQQKHNIGKMTDLIFVVKDVKEFHKVNIEINKNHYSNTALLFGINTLALINRFGTKIYYNPSVSVDGVFIKYGIIQESDFIANLNHWDNLFIAGRFHKPVLKLMGNNLENVLKENHESAVFRFKL